MSASEQATVAIVGRPNVGKSAIFNRLAGRRLAIVHDQPGVTRDRLFAPCKVTIHPCQLVDTGGIGAILDDGFAAQVSAEADIAMETADLILFVVDSREGMTSVDQTIGQRLRKAKPPVLLVLNKSDTPTQDLAIGELSQLGFGGGVSVSAAHGRGFGELTQKIDAHLAQLGFAKNPENQPKGEGFEEDEQAVPEPDSPLKIAIIGRPNVGKSSLINSILKDKRTIVSNIAGTTRDAVDIPYTFGEKPYILIDTAGLRPRSKRDSSVEVFSAMRTEKAIRRSDLCVMVVDAGQGITNMDRKIAGLIAEEQKPCLLVINKFDLFHPSGEKKARLEEIEEILRRELFFVSYAPFICTSAINNQGITKVFSEIQKIRNAAIKKIGTGVLNRILQQAMAANPPSSKMANRRLNLLYATTAVNEKYTAIPVPAFILFVNDKRLLSESYEQYLVNKLRQAHPMPGIPILFSPRSRRSEPPKH